MGKDNVKLQNITTFKQSFGGETEISRTSVCVPVKPIIEAKNGLKKYYEKKSGNKIIKYAITNRKRASSVL